ncbi:hypothetical protein V491_00253 [Pseudogymnoascus sp. VKM F-3775]|nr:hypothetical protein V491_00253 [Pseudogymnoascus sp. VKM F-3775]
MPSRFSIYEVGARDTDSKADDKSIWTLVTSRKTTESINTMDSSPPPENGDWPTPSRHYHRGFVASVYLSEEAGDHTQSLS